MDEMTAFERQVGVVLRRMGGPEPGFDAMRIARSAIDSATPGYRAVITRRLRGSLPTPMERGLDMFSALRFIVAGVIVALFGAVLLAGLFAAPAGDPAAPAAATESPSPTVTAELLAGMTTEEVEPGVVRLLGDGVRELGPGAVEQLSVGGDGSVWTFAADGFHRLGAEPSQHLAASADLPPHDRFGVGADGTLWVDGARWDSAPWEGLGSFGGERWTWHRPGGIPADHRPWGLRIDADGSAWVLLAGRGRWQPQDALLAHLDGDRWDVIDFVPGALPELFAGDRSSVWAVRDFAPALFRFDGSTWQQMDTPAALGLSQRELVVGPYDTLWARAWEGEVADFGQPPTAMLHYDGAEWQRWAEGDFPTEDDANLLWAFQPMAAGPDGGLWGQVRWGSWVSPFSPDWTEPVCGGVAHFDGVTVSRYLQELCVRTIDVAPDGWAWLLAGPADGEYDTYVIAAEAVSATL